MLQNEAVVTRENVIGTTIIVGLTSRSLAILSMNIQEAGMPPDEISDIWIAKLDAELQTAINGTITDDNQKTSCALGLETEAPPCPGRRRGGGELTGGVDRTKNRRSPRLGPTDWLS